MRFFQGIKNGSFASFGFSAALIATVACASCGSKNGGIGDGSAGEGNDDGGEDGSAGDCTGFGACPTGGDDSGFKGQGDDSGISMQQRIDGSFIENDCSSSKDVSASAYSALKAASSAGGMKMLYPYDQTVYPGGIAPPLLMWSQSSAPDTAYLHLKSQQFDYEGCFKVGKNFANNPTSLTIPADVWGHAFAQSNGKGDPVSVTLATLAGSAASVVKQTLIFAKGNLAGDVYYNTYGSNLNPAKNGAVIRISKGTASTVLYTPGITPVGPCVSCHSLSADGSWLAAQQHGYPSPMPLNGKGSMTFSLLKTPKPDPGNPQASTTMDDWGFSGVYPNGSFLMSCGESGDTSSQFAFPGQKNNNPGMIGPKAATLYNTSNGMVIPSSGLPGKGYAMMPMFSPDGKKVVFNDFDDGNGHSLVVMDVALTGGSVVGDKAVKQGEAAPPTSVAFSNKQVIFSGSDTQYAGWPFFTPDGKWVVFAVGNLDNYATVAAPPVSVPVGASQLYYVSVSGGTAHRLDSLSGHNGGSLYLPQGMADDTLDFYPTVNPVSTGGYMWVYFTSRRSYGNKYKDSTDPGSKSIWVSAFDLGANGSADPSHPAFYLPGQELSTGNIRAFSVLRPCIQDNDTTMSCEAGYDCCGGNCAGNKCVPPTTCAADGGRCTKDSDCCDHSESCISGYCAIIPH